MRVSVDMVLVVGMTLLSARVLGQVACPYNFNPVSGDGVPGDGYKISVFAIGTRKDHAAYQHRGTAYLIRTRGDHALTAAHVVQDVDQIVGKSEALSQQEFEFELVAKTDTGNAKRDIALLKLVSGEIPRDAPRLEYRVTEPGRGESLVGLGHPMFDDDYALVRTEPIFRRKVVGKGLLEFESRTRRGASGGPIFDETGRVVATVVESSADRQLAFGFPSGSQELVDLLVNGNLQLSDDGEKIDKELRNPELNQGVIASRLEYRPYNVSNMDLLLLSVRIAENAGAYNHAMLVCPVIQAMV